MSCLLLQKSVWYAIGVGGVGKNEFSLFFYIFMSQMGSITLWVLSIFGVCDDGMVYLRRSLWRLNLYAITRGDFQLCHKFWYKTSSDFFHLLGTGTGGIGKNSSVFSINWEKLSISTLQRFGKESYFKSSILSNSNISCFHFPFHERFLRIPYFLFFNETTFLFE